MADTYDEKARDWAHEKAFRMPIHTEFVPLVAAALRESADTARAEEREACAKVADNAASSYASPVGGYDHGGRNAARGIATAIRNRT